MSHCRVLASTPPAGQIDPAQTRLVQELKHTSPLIGCRFDPTGRFVFAGAQDNTSAALGPGDRQEDRPDRPRELGPRPGVPTRRTDSLQRRLRRPDLAGRRRRDAAPPSQTIDAHDGWVRAVAVSPDGKLLATLRQRQPRQALVRRRRQAGARVRRPRSARLQRRLSSRRPAPGLGDLQGVVKHWDLAERTPSRASSTPASCTSTTRPSGPTIGGIRSMAFSRDGSPAGLRRHHRRDATPSPASASRWWCCSTGRPASATQLLRPEGELPGHRLGRGLPPGRLRGRRRRRQRRGAVVLEARAGAGRSTR